MQRRGELDNYIKDWRHIRHILCSKADRSWYEKLFKLAGKCLFKLLLSQSPTVLDLIWRLHILMPRKLFFTMTWIKEIVLSYIWRNIVTKKIWCPIKKETLWYKASSKTMAQNVWLIHDRSSIGMPNSDLCMFIKEYASNEFLMLDVDNMSIVGQDDIKIDAQ